MRFREGICFLQSALFLHGFQRTAKGVSPGNTGVPASSGGVMSQILRFCMVLGDLS